jgi:hypothetical protein
MATVSMPTREAHRGEIHMSRPAYWLMKAGATRMYVDRMDRYIILASWDDEIFPRSIMTAVLPFLVAARALPHRKWRRSYFPIPIRSNPLTTGWNTHSTN